MRQCKKCSECGKALRNDNENSLCSYHYSLHNQRERRKYNKSKLKMKLYKVEFEGMYPVGNCLIILAEKIKEARNLAQETIKHTKVFNVEEVKMDKSKVVEYLSGDY